MQEEESFRARKLQASIIKDNCYGTYCDGTSWRHYDIDIYGFIQEGESFWVRKLQACQPNLTAVYNM